MFGIVASLVFILLEPVFTKLVSPKEEKPEISLQEINLPEEKNEVLPENMIQDEHELEEKDKPQADPEPMISSMQKAELEIEDYQKMYGKLAGLAEEAGQSMVVVNGFSSDVDWFSNVYEKKSSVSGFCSFRRMYCCIMGERVAIAVTLLCFRVESGELSVEIYIYP